MMISLMGFILALALPLVIGITDTLSRKLARASRRPHDRAGHVGAANVSNPRRFETSWRLRSCSFSHRGAFRGSLRQLE